MEHSKQSFSPVTQYQYYYQNQFSTQSITNSTPFFIISSVTSSLFVASSFLRFFILTSTSVLLTGSSLAPSKPHLLTTVLHSSFYIPQNISFKAFLSSFSSTAYLLILSFSLPQLSTFLPFTLSPSFWNNFLFPLTAFFSIYLLTLTLLPSYSRANAHSSLQCCSLNY